MADDLGRVRLAGEVGIECRRRFAATTLVVMVAIATAFAISEPQFASATNANKALGKWTRPFELATTPVHFAIGPCDSSQPGALRDSFHSQILWFAGSNSAHPYGGLLLWKSPTDTTDSFADDTLTAFPGGNIYSRLIGDAPRNAFCGGMTRLGDGRLFISGGTEDNSDEVGIAENTLFGSQSRTWDTSADPITMANRRWYSTATTLPNGKVLVTSGSIYRHLHIFGGTYYNDTSVAYLPNAITRLGLSASGDWDGRVSDATLGSSSDTIPFPREFHTCTPSPTRGCDMYFGGRDSTSTANRAFNDVLWAYRGEPVGATDYSYAWVKLLVGGLSKPSPRYQHAATTDPSGDLLVHGGVQSLGVGSWATFDDVWIVRDNHDSNPRTYTWFKAVEETASVAPGRRCGHAMFKDEDSQTIYVFGGSADPYSAPTDSAVYSLQIAFDGASYSATWDTLHVVGASPPPLSNFAYVTDPGLRFFGNTSGGQPRYNRRAFVFGGRDKAGHLSSDLWQLWFVKDSSAAGVHGLWQKISASGPAPTARMNSAMAIEANFDRLVVLGGDTTLARDRDAAVRAIVVDNVYPGSTATLTWSDFGTAGVSPLKKFSGATAHEWGNECFARAPETFDPSPSASPKMVTDASDPHLADWYPQMFVLPDTATDHQLVFEAGPRKDAWLYDADETAGSRWQPVDTTITKSTEFRGGTSVLYRVGATNRILKVGSRDTDVPYRRAAVDTAMTINLGASPTTYRSVASWHIESPMKYPRVNHNLALLPTGDVLVVGGTRIVGNDLEAHDDWQSVPFNYTPELWHYASGAMRWDTLLADPFHYPRGYHSSILLMPDARVLVGGGNTILDNTSRAYCNSVQIFSPPYLFGADEKLLPRPHYVTGGGPSGYRGAFETFVFDTTVDSLVLIRGAATTHAFNMEQRRIPMFRDNSTHTDVNSSGYHEFTIAMPTDSALAPPGDYMVFALKSGFAPSIARWVRISNPSGWDPNDMIRPGKVAWSMSTTGCDHEFSWNAPADDSTYAISGKVAGYDIRYATGSTSPCTTCWSTFNGMTSISTGPLTGAAPGDPESFSAAGLLSAGTTYKFQAVSYDDRRPAPYQTSVLSSVITFHENGCEEEFYAGGGDGGGASAKRDRGAGAASANRTSGQSSETSLLDGLGATETREEMVPLNSAPMDVNGSLRIHLRGGKNGSVTFTKAQLVAVDFSSGAATAVPLGSRAVSGTLASASRITDGSKVVTSEFSGDDSNPFHGFAGETLVVTLPQPEGTAVDTPLPLVLRAGGVPAVGAGEHSGVQVQVPDGTGGWRTLARHVPHDHFSLFPTDSVAGLTVRLVLLSDLDLSSVSRLVPSASSARITTASLVSATHSTLGELGSNVLSGSGSGVRLAARDTMTLDFANLAQPDTLNRLWYLRVAGSGDGSSAQSARAGRTEAPPAAFSLGQNRPNPFTGSTIIRFAVPRAAFVQLEVFDLLGRRVQVLASRKFDAGYQEVEWNRRTSSGEPAQAGVYFYRMVSGDFRAQRKMILSP